MTKSVEEQALVYMKDAFRRYLLEQLGPIDDKPLMELRAWNLALLEVDYLVRCQRRAEPSRRVSLEDKTLKQD